MDAKTEHLVRTMNKILKERYQSYQINYPDYVGLQVMMIGRQVMENDFCTALKQIPPQILKENGVRGLLQDTTGMEQIASMLFLQAISAAYKKLGLSIF
jgi:hypothetical protein